MYNQKQHKKTYNYQNRNIKLLVRNIKTKQHYNIKLINNKQTKFKETTMKKFKIIIIYQLIVLMMLKLH